MAALTLSALNKSFGAVTVVNDLSLEVQRGEFLTLLGPSGCGKSTILRMIAGLDSPTSGAITFDGRRMNEVDPGQRNVAMVFQSYALYPHMTVQQNLEYPLRKRGVPRPRRAELVAEVANILQIGPLLDRRSAQLSGGQQQRVALGRAMIRNPQMFLFDEPLSNLDATLRAHMRVEIMRLHQRLGKTMVYVTHDQVEAMTMSTRIAVLEAGRLQQFGTPEEVYSRPATRFVAGFVGTPRMNFVPGRLRAAGAGCVFQADGFALEVAVPGLAGVDRPAIGGLRPQDLVPDASGAAGRVTLLESTGQEVIVTVDTGTQEVVLRLDEANGLRIGDNLALAARPGRLHLFDPETERRIGP